MNDTILHTDLNDEFRNQRARIWKGKMGPLHQDFIDAAKEMKRERRWDRARR